MCPFNCCFHALFFAFYSLFASTTATCHLRHLRPTNDGIPGEQRRNACLERTKWAWENDVDAGIDRDDEKAHWTLPSDDGFPTDVQCQALDGLPSRFTNDSWEKIEEKLHEALLTERRHNSTLVKINDDLFDYFTETFCTSSWALAAYFGAPTIDDDDDRITIIGHNRHMEIHLEDGSTYFNLFVLATQNSPQFLHETAFRSFVEDKLKSAVKARPNPTHRSVAKYLQHQLRQYDAQRSFKIVAFSIDVDDVDSFDARLDQSLHFADCTDRRHLEIDEEICVIVSW